ncbi:MAG: hypothetical protein QOG97_481, partial [Acidimicrobiaceae bacterium]|nr:hypothetical protein [Acidimicrobiaceae bacterium]
VAALAAVSFLAAVSCDGSGGRSATRRISTTVASATTVAPSTAPPTAPPTAPATAPPTTPAPTTTAPPPTTRAPLPKIGGAGVAIGDSVLEDVQLYAPATLTSRNIAINAAVGRQWAAGVSILASLRASGKLPPVVIVALGSNGQVKAAQFDQMMQACAGAKRVIFMTVTGPLIGNNPVISAGVARYPTAALADWYTLGTAHPDWFAADHVHIGPAGATALGNLLASMN